MIFELAYAFKIDPNLIKKWKYNKVIWYYMQIKKKEYTEKEEKYEIIKNIINIISPNKIKEPENKEITVSYNPNISETLEKIKEELKNG